jgi:proteasome assembly chaperone (PAC2) family protein
VPGDAIRYEPGAEETRLNQPHALVAFGGWVDAGSGGTGAVRHLISSLASRKLAHVDPEEFYSFTDTRPLVSIVGPGERAVHWPRAEFHAATVPPEQDLVLFVAPEPNLKWRSFAQNLLDVLQQLDVQSLTCVGSIFGAVHHRADVRLTGWANEPKLRDKLVRQNVAFTNYEGPTGFVTVLLAEAQSRGLPAAAVMGFAPNYIQGVPNPRVSCALLKTFSSITGLSLQLNDLERAGRALTRQVDRLLTEQPQLREQVERMLNLMNVTEPLVSTQEDDEPEAGLPSPDAPPPGPPTELPNPQAVVSELEEFLKQLRQGDGPDGSNAPEPGTNL